MIRAKNYKTVSKFVKVMTKILWSLFSRTRCRPLSSPVLHCSYRPTCECDESRPN